MLNQCVKVCSYYKVLPKVANKMSALLTYSLFLPPTTGQKKVDISLKTGVFRPQKQFCRSRNLVLRTSCFIASVLQEQWTIIVLRTGIEELFQFQLWSRYFCTTWGTTVTKVYVDGWTQEPATETIVFKNPAAVTRRHKTRTRACNEIDLVLSLYLLWDFVAFSMIISTLLSILDTSMERLCSSLHLLLLL